MTHWAEKRSSEPTYYVLVSETTDSDGLTLLLQAVMQQHTYSQDAPSWLGETSFFDPADWL